MAYPGLPKPKKTKGNKPTNYGKWYQGTGDFGTTTYQGYTFPQLNIPWLGPVSYGLSGQYPPMYGNQYKPPKRSTPVPGPIPNSGYTPGFMYGAQGGMSGGTGNQPAGGGAVNPQFGGWSGTQSYVAPGGLSSTDWLGMGQGYTPFSYFNPQYGGYWNGSGIDYGVSPLNVQRTYDMAQPGWAEANPGLGNSMNQYGQPIGTPGPIQVKGPRGRGFAVPHSGPPSNPADQIAQTQAMIDALTARLQAKPKNKNDDAHWDPYSKQMERLQNRLAILQKLYGGQANAGVQYAGGGQMASWRA